MSSGAAACQPRARAASFLYPVCVACVSRCDGMLACLYSNSPEPHLASVAAGAQGQRVHAAAARCEPRGHSSADAAAESGGRGGEEVIRLLRSTPDCVTVLYLHICLA